MICRKLIDRLFLVPKQYDFIVVGSGSAGSALANRLSEIGEWSVLLIEAGKPANLISKVPLFAPMMYFTEHTAKIFMEKQENMCLGLQVIMSMYFYEI